MLPQPTWIEPVRDDALGTAIAYLLLTLVAMHWSAQVLARQSAQLFGRRLQLYLFGFPGTVVHEGSHVLACLLFGHRVDRVRWFDPQATDGALGSVEHSYNPTSAYQRLGTIVIAVAPLLGGATVFLLAARHLLGIPFTSLADLATLADVASLTPLAARIEAWRWALFTYTCLSVGGSMHLSTADLRGAGRGAIVLTVSLTTAVLLLAGAWWVSSAVAPTFWPRYVEPGLLQLGRWAARGSDALRAALLLSVAVNVAGAALLMLVRRILRAGR